MARASITQREAEADQDEPLLFLAHLALARKMASWDETDTMALEEHRYLKRGFSFIFWWDSERPGLSIGITVGVVALVVFCCVCASAGRRKEFQDKLEAARQVTSVGPYNVGGAPPVDGTYESGFTFDPRVKKVCKLAFAPLTDGGFAISGSTRVFKNDSFRQEWRITEGRVGPGGAAYWVEQGEQSFSVGKFDFSDANNATFRGAVVHGKQDDVVEDGPYVGFRLVERKTIGASQTVPKVALNVPYASPPSNAKPQAVTDHHAKLPATAVLESSTISC